MSHNHTRVAVEFDAIWSELTVAPDADIVRIQASDLREAQQQRARLRAEAVERGESADGTAVFLDLEIHIAADARTARREFAGLDAPISPSSIRYVGTPSGLASLISDVTAADVADGVTLQVHDDVNRQSTFLSSGVLPLLGSRGTRFDVDAVDEVLGASRIAPTLAS
ncbi:hypothetical protein CH254_19355 [Rhodococcus sp. 06-412-2C]|uniref:hypothetical protein n=1 Tax=unclassified Rhodococcus (in: high G+C Gram-positive bacteria) TaxID=192944 RepID=UPI000B9BC2EB|nr:MULTISPECIES: hypothetical protein [unclassified Rhodococcus (in: high G+C Gram-positive bacteria)]OZC84591.1 hypothetical protein CH254_19355 [Rhodococcus sp. 06-412-2C]OZC98243.1 hypothetical protein CH279_12000 [Rhodococcus sp. 06-412-2B]